MWLNKLSCCVIIHVYTILNRGAHTLLGLTLQAKLKQITHRRKKFSAPQKSKLGTCSVARLLQPGCSAAISMATSFCSMSSVEGLLTGWAPFRTWVVIVHVSVLSLNHSRAGAEGRMGFFVLGCLRLGTRVSCLGNGGTQTLWILLPSTSPLPPKSSLRLQKSPPESQANAQTRNVR